MRDISVVLLYQKLHQHQRMYYLLLFLLLQSLVFFTSRPRATPGLQQIFDKNIKLPSGPEIYGPPPNARLDHTFIGLSGGQIFHEMMLRHGVKHIFGYPGGAILPVFDAIYQSPHFQFVLPRHEQGAGHMAEGYARVPGVVLVTSGPGATNWMRSLMVCPSSFLPAR
jgi:acetolactate synthase I/II/III large subunit